MEKVAVLSAVAIGLYLYQNKSLSSASTGRGTGESGGETGDGAGGGGDGEGTTSSGDNPCPEGYRVNDAGTACTPLNPCDEGYELSTDGTCKLVGSPCNKGYKLSADGKTCDFDGNPCGDDCLTYDKETKKCKAIPNCGTKTGSDAGDIALNIGVGVVSGAIMDKVLYDSLDAVDRRIAQKASAEVAEKAGQKAGLEVAEEVGEKAGQKAGLEVAEKAGKEVAEKAGLEVAEKVGQKAGLEVAEKVAMREARELLTKRTAQVVAKQSAKEIAQILGRKLAVKIAQMSAKMTASSSTGVGAILAPFTAMAIANAVALASTGTYFEKDAPEDKAWEDIDETARAFFEAIPFWGDLVSILGSYFAFKTGCPTGTYNENGLCYAPPHPDFSCEAFLCYAKASAYPNPMPMSAGGESLAFMTKGVRSEPGDIPNICPPGMEHGTGGAFCYEKRDWATAGITLGTAWEACPPGMTDTGDRCEDFYGTGVGEGRVCPAGWKTNLLTCEEPIQTGLEPCPEGSTDVLGTCWGKETNCVGGCGGDCGCDWWAGTCWGRCCGCSWKSTTDKVFKNLHERGTLRLSGGNILGRGAGSSLPCPEGKSVGYDQLCYNECREGFRREGLLCTRSFQKRRETLAPHGNLCPDDKFDNGGGLCYTKDDRMPQGYFRRTFGLLEPRPPEDKPEWYGLESFNPTSDSPLTVKKATYTRKPYPIFSIYLMKPRKNEEPPDEPLPPLCSSLEDAKPGVDKVLCREDTPAGKEITQDGLSFYQKCREGYEFLVGTKKCSKVSEDGESKDEYDNSEGFAEVIYYKK